MSLGLQAQPIRIVWVAGDEKAHIAEGFYVWLGDMLIGEALPGKPHEHKGPGTIEPSYWFFSPKGAAPAFFSLLSYDLGGSWAPESIGFSARKEKGGKKGFFGFTLTSPCAKR